MPRTIYHDILDSLRQLYQEDARPCLDNSTPSCSHFRFGCWICTLAEHGRVSEGLLDASDKRMEADSQKRLAPNAFPENHMQRDIFRSKLIGR